MNKCTKMDCNNEASYSFHITDDIDYTCQEHYEYSIKCIELRNSLVKMMGLEATPREMPKRLEVKQEQVNA